MSLLILLLSSLLFCIYFYMIGLSYFSLFPLLFFLVVLFYIFKSYSKKIDFLSFFEKHGFLFAWFLVLVWLYFLLYFLNFSFSFISIILIVFNLIWWFLSVVFSYLDGKLFFKLWFFLSFILYSVFSYFIYWNNILFVLSNFAYISVWVLSLFSLINYLFKKEENSLHYLLFSFVILSFILTIFIIEIDFALSVFSWLLLLSIIFWIFFHILNFKILTKTETKEMSIRRILAWEKILQKETSRKFLDKRSLYNFVKNTPLWTKYVLESFNVILIISLMVHYLSVVLIPNLYFFSFCWLSVWLFLINIFTLKKFDYVSIIQKLSLFLVANFAFYLTLMMLSTFFDFSQLVIFAILWNLLNIALFLNAAKISLFAYFNKMDYSFWILVNILSCVVNIVLLLNLNFASELLFSLLAVYIWISWALFFYSLKYLRKVFTHHDLFLE